MKNCFKIIIPVFSHNVSGKSFQIFGQNPGLGGTQYVSIKLAGMLAMKLPNTQLELVNQGIINIPQAPANLTVKLCVDINQYFEFLDVDSTNYAVVIPATLLKRVEPRLIQLHSKHIIAWVHHPFWLDLRLKSVAACVHVGSYQYFSNCLFYKRNWIINNLFNLPGKFSVRTAPNEESKIRIVFLGALIRAKGFGHLARQWSAIKKEFPQSELHVIGSSQTYGKLAEHPLIPCDFNFAEEILKYIPIKDIESKSVIFHGNLGPEKFKVILSAHLAVCNPTGASEAFPASPLECMACGLPVIASDDYGMSDSMRFFPELILSSPDEIPKRIQFVMSDRWRYEELSARSIAVAAWFDSQTDVTLARWRRLIEQVARGRGQGLKDFQPIGTIYGSVFILRLRQFRAIIRALIQLIFQNT